MRLRVGLIAIAIIVLAVILAAGSASVDSEVATIVARGDAYRDAYLYSIASDQYLQALERQPGNPAILVRLCDVSQRLGRRDDAATYADRAEGAGASRAEVARCRARNAESSGQASRAAEQWSIAVAEQPEDRNAQMSLIGALVAAHDWQAAAAQAQAMLDADPGDAAALFFRGALLALDDPLRARPYLRQAGTPESLALADALDDPLGLSDRGYRAVSIGRVFLEHGRLPLAWRAFIAATAGNPGYADAFAYLGITYDRLGDEALAGAFLDRALELDPSSPVGPYLRGVFLSRRARWAEARADLERALQFDPANPAIAFALGRALVELGHFAEADDHFVRALASEPDDFGWRLALAELYIGRLIRVTDRGLPAARRAVELNPGSAEARAWLGWGLHLTGEHGQAEAELRTAISLDPALARARLYLGNVLVNVGRFEEGRTELLRAVDLDPHGEIGARARQLLGDR
ncbi:MAG TPA: tetratricopeptide repeat protein [Anaerolineae bacterium]|nr:tetratricopeptide repeat protein [Anaerolineae bacterium]